MSVDTCPEAMEIADPVMKAEMATMGMNSTMKPNLMRPRKSSTAPQMNASVRAISPATKSG